MEMSMQQVHGGGIACFPAHPSGNEGSRFGLREKPGYDVVKVDPASSGLARSFKGVWSEAFIAAGPGLLPRKGPNLGQMTVFHRGNSWGGLAAPGLEGALRLHQGWRRRPGTEPEAQQAQIEEGQWVMVTEKGPEEGEGRRATP